MVREALAPLGAAVSVAGSAADALAVAARVKPDLFLLDIGLPDIDGWRLCAKLREAGHVQARVVILSASAMEEHRTAIAATPHDAFLMRPIDLSRLVDAVSGLLRRADVPSPRAPAPPPSGDFARSAEYDALLRFCRIGACLLFL